MITNSRRSKKNPQQSIFLSIFLTFLAIGVISFLIFTNWRINQKRAEFKQRIEALKKEVEVLEEKTALLRAGISQTESKDYQTKRLYEQGYFEAGAIPVVVLPPKKEAVKEEKRLLNSQNWWEWLKNKLRD